MPRSRVGRCSASRTCRWMSAAPAASQRRAVSTTSSSVVGSCGRSALACSAPVGATVMSVPVDPGGRRRHGVILSGDGVMPQPGRRVRDRRIFGAQPCTTTVCAAETPPTRQFGVLGDGALDHREGHRAVLVVPRDGRHPPDLARPDARRPCRAPAARAPTRRGGGRRADAAVDRGCGRGRSSPGRGSSPCAGGRRCAASRARAGWCGGRSRSRAGAARPRPAAPRPPRSRPAGGRRRRPRARRAATSSSRHARPSAGCPSAGP